jgi:hypothetical protein
MSREAVALTIVGSGLAVVLLCILGWYGYQAHDEQLLIDQVQSSELLHGVRVQSADEIRQELRNLESTYGASRSEARGVVRAFH